MHPVVLSKTKIPDKPSVTVRDYLMLTLSATLGAHDHAGDEMSQSVARYTAAILRDARVFHLNPASYFAAYHAADVYTTTTLAGLPWREPDIASQMFDPTTSSNQPLLSAIFNDGLMHGTKSLLGRKATGRDVAADNARVAEGRALLAAMTEGQLQEPFPSPLPFPSIYIGFGGDIGLSPFQVATALQESTIDNARPEFGARHLGYTLGDTERHGPVVLEHMHTKSDGPLTITRYFNGEWVGLMSLAPWVVNSLVALINENRTIVEENPVTPAMRYEHARVKIDRMIPRPFYTLRLKPQVIDESMRRNVTLGRYTFHYTYRFDVRGHERIRVQRGEGPIDEKARKKLVERDYVIYEPGMPLDEVLMKKLDVRGFRRPTSTEWLAVLTSWINPHQKGPDGAPYVPAVRAVKGAA